MSKYQVYICGGEPNGVSTSFEVDGHWKFYSHSVSKYCPKCMEIWCQIWMDGCDEAWPEICYCRAHAKLAEHKLYPNIYVAQMPLPGSILDAWACLPAHSERDPLNFLPAELIKREFDLYMYLLDIGVLTDEQPSANPTIVPSTVSSDLDSWLQNPA